MKKAAPGLLLILFAFMLSATAAFAETGSSTYLPADRDQELPFYNDAHEQMKLRGADDFSCQWRVPATIPTSLLRDERGILYFTDNSGISAVSPEGKMIWSYKLPTPGGLKYAVLGVDGTIYAFEAGESYYHTNGAVFAFQPGGEVKWVYELKDFQSIEFSRFVGDADGNFVLETENGIASIAPGGNVNWVNGDLFKATKTDYDFTETNVTGIYADKRGNIVVDNNTGDGIYALDTKGKVIWQSSLDGEVYVAGNVAYVLSAKGIHALDTATGTELEVRPADIPLDSALPTDHEGGYYVSVKNGIAKIDSKGNTEWTYEIREVGYRDAYHLTSDADGNVYFTNNGGSVYSLNKAGQERFVFFIQNHYSSGSEMTTDSAGNVYFLGDGVGLAKLQPQPAQIRIRMGSKEVFLPVHPVVQNGTTLLPMRKLFEMFGAAIEWNPDTQTVTARKGDATISVTVGSKTAQINGRDTALQEAPVILQGNTLVPLRFVGEALGYKVKWDNEERVIQLSSSDDPAVGFPVAAATKTILSDVQNRFFLVTGGNWQKGASDKVKFIASDDQNRFLAVDAFLKADLSANAGLSDVESLVRSNIAGAMADPDFGKSAELNIGGLHAVQFEVSGEFSKLKLHYIFTLIEGADRYYELMEWTLESGFTDAIGPFEEIVKSFQTMDPQQHQLSKL